MSQFLYIFYLQLRHEAYNRGRGLGKRREGASDFHVLMVDTMSQRGIPL